MKQKWGKKGTYDGCFHATTASHTNLGVMKNNMNHIKLSLVGNLLRSNRQVNTDTFKGTSLCQIKSVITATSGASLCVSKLYAPRTL
jgi:hypothetical protein